MAVDVKDKLVTLEDLKVVGDATKDLKEDLADIEKVIPIVSSASGSIASFSDGADGWPVKTLTCEINPVQDLHGYDHPWPAGGGENIIPPPTTITVNGTGLSVTDDNGKLTINGNAQSGDSIFINIPVTFINEGYILSMLNSFAGATLYFYNDNTSVDYFSLNTANRVVNEQSMTTLYGKAFNRYRIMFSTDQTLSNASISVMAVLSDADTSSFTPYSNICPISGHTDVNVTRTGKNLFDSTFSHYTQPSDYRICPIKLEVGATYSYSAKLTGTAQTNFLVGLAKKGDRYQNFGAFITIVNASTAETLQTGSFTVDSAYTDPKLIVYCANEAAFDVIFNNYEVQLELGSTASDYEPYTGTTIPVSWQTEAGTVYGGTLDVVSGLLTVTMASVDLGTLNWFRQSWNNWNTYYTSDYLTIITQLNMRTVPSSEKPNWLCSSYKAVSANNLYSYGVGIAQNTGILISDANDRTTEEFKSAMNGVQLVYELATPVTYQLTPQQITSLLGQNNVWHDANGDTTAEYRADTKLYIDKKIADLQTLIASL